MKWVKHSDYAYMSDCGRYSVTRIGTAVGRFYEAWQTRQHPDGVHLIATVLPTAKAAQKLVKEHDGSLNEEKA